MTMLGHQHENHNQYPATVSCYTQQLKRFRQCKRCHIGHVAAYDKSSQLLTYLLTYSRYPRMFSLQD